MTDHLFGQTCALLAAVTWAMALVLFKRSGERIPPIALNLYKNVVALVLLIVTVAFLLITGQYSIDTLRQHCLGDVCLLLLSGVLGIALADTMFFHALNLIGVGLISIADCSYMPLMVLFAWLLLSEELTALHYAGVGLIVGGVFIATRHTLPENRTRWQIVLGMLLAVASMAVMAFGIVIAKPVLEETPVIWATTVRMVAGLGLLSLVALLGRDWKEHWGGVSTIPGLEDALPASVLGAYLAMVLWVAGFAYTYATVAAVLNQTSAIFAAVLAALVLKEHFGGRKIAALVLAMIGVVIVTLHDGLHLAWERWSGQ